MRKELEEIKCKEPSTGIEREVDLTAKLDKLLTREEDMWRQKSREIWLREGDKSTKYLHSITIYRRKFNRLGDRISIGSEICSQISNTLSSKGPISLQIMKLVVQPILNLEDNRSLISFP